MFGVLLFGVLLVVEFDCVPLFVVGLIACLCGYDLRFGVYLFAFVVLYLVACFCLLVVFDGVFCVCFLLFHVGLFGYLLLLVCV